MLEKRHGLPRWLSGKESACNAEDAGDRGLIPGWGRSPGGGNGNLLQYSCLEISMDRGAWQTTAQGVTVRQGWVTEHTRTLDKFPRVIYTKTLLFINPICNNLHLLTSVYIPHSQSFAPSPHFPLATTSLFSVSVSLFLFCRYVHLWHIVDSTYKW